MIRPTNLARPGAAAVLLNYDCVLRPAWLHWSLQCPFVAEPGWCVQDVQKNAAVAPPQMGEVATIQRNYAVIAGVDVP
jgi:hypothetical protein